MLVMSVYSVFWRNSSRPKGQNLTLDQQAKIELKANGPKMNKSLTFKVESFSAFHKIIVFYYNVRLHIVFYGVKYPFRWEPDRV